MRHVALIIKRLFCPHPVWDLVSRRNWITILRCDRCGKTVRRRD